jgi:hypothetical protein
MSYQILVGIVMNKNKSLRHLPTIIKNTLESDYNIEVTSQEFKPESDLLDRAIEIQIAWKNAQMVAKIPYCDSLVPDEELGKKLKERKSLGILDLTEHEKLQLWIFHVAYELYEVPLYFVDEEFFNTFIFYSDHKGVASAFEMFFKIKRFIDLCSRPLESNEQILFKKINNITKKASYNLELYKTKTTYFKVLIEASKFYIGLCGNPEILLSIEETQKVVNATETDNKFKTYIGSMDPADYKTLVNMFGLTRAYNNRDGYLKWDTRKCTFFIKKILNTAFDISYGVVRVGPKARAKVETRVFAQDLITQLGAKYNSNILQDGCKYDFSTYQFAD